jgi:hypothetical protein
MEILVGETALRGFFEDWWRTWGDHVLPRPQAA